MLAGPPLSHSFHDEEARMSLGDATIGQLMIPVDDLERGIDFYRDVLGLRFLFAAPPQMAFFQCGAVRLLVGVPPPGEKPQRGGAIYFRVADIQSVFAALNGRGVRFRADPHVVHRTPAQELWLAEFVDPDGNPLALMSEVAIGAGRP
jgi:catechol 2,3-dioxygenase-like lactoylglutathione lyase family enzyme